MKYNIGDIIYVEVTSIVPYGVFTKAEYDYTGLIHISEITGKYINNITKYFRIGNVIKVKIIGIDNEKKHLKLSTKDFLLDSDPYNGRILEESGLGFKELEEKLPEWIEVAKKEIENSK